MRGGKVGKRNRSKERPFMPNEVKSEKLDNSYRLSYLRKTAEGSSFTPLIYCLSVTLVICLQPDSLWMGLPVLTFRLPSRQRKKKVTRTFGCDLMLQASVTQAGNDTSASSLPPVLQQHCVASSHQKNDSYVNFVECCSGLLVRLYCTMEKHTTNGKLGKAKPEREINSV